jgi:hypothetical protein
MMSKGGLVVVGGRTSCDRLSKASLSENEGDDMDGVNFYGPGQVMCNHFSLSVRAF